MTLTLRSAEILLEDPVKPGNLSIKTLDEKGGKMGMYELEKIDELIKKSIVEQLGPMAALHMERKSFGSRW